MFSFRRQSNRTIKFFAACTVFYEFLLHFFIDQQVFPQLSCLTKLTMLLSMCNALKRIQGPKIQTVISCLDSSEAMLSLSQLLKMSVQICHCNKYICCGKCNLLNQLAFKLFKFCFDASNALAMTYSKDSFHLGLQYYPGSSISKRENIFIDARTDVASKDRRTVPLKLIIQTGSIA